MKDEIVIIEKYEKAFAYIYNIVRTMPKEHRVLRDAILSILIKQVEAIYIALKANSKGRANDVDSNLASIRFFIRHLEEHYDFSKYLSQKNRRVDSPRWRCPSFTLDWRAG